ncbi:MAG: exodeoxyribonuclease VII large subunit [Brevinema sp.]
MKGLEKSALSVSAVAFFISNLIKDQLGPVLVKGEISNLQLRKHSSYVRFSLKDSSAKIDCLTHQSTNAAKLLEHLQDGDEVIIFAQPSFYIKSGQMSFFADEMMKLGAGIFRTKLEQLKQTLYEEGLFDQGNKKSLPSYPEHVGIVTSADGAALQDIIRVAQDRYPLVKITVFPSLVQGSDAPKSLFEALTLALGQDNLDAIIIGRGGGSVEDLQAFNDEKLVRLVFSAETPIIAAVGHEIDKSLVDYAADISAPTPTGAAMVLFPDKQELLKELSYIKDDLHQLMFNTLNEEAKFIQQKKSDLQLLFQYTLEKEENQLKYLKLQSEENNPVHILKKGYAIIEPHQDWKIGSEIRIITKNKTLSATINTIKDRINEK